MSEITPPTTRNVTIMDVAEESGVSYSTVSRVLNGYAYVKESTRQKVLGTAERLGYVANVQARSLAGGKANVIGLLIPGLDTGYTTEISRSIDEELAKTDWDLMLFTIHRRQGKELALVRKITQGLTDGIILVVPVDSSTYLSMLKERNFPYVVIDQATDLEAGAWVEGTDWQGAYDATEYLLELGHKRIGFITGLAGIQSAKQRLDGYVAALTEYGIPIDQDLIISGDYFTPSGYEAAQQLLALGDRPTAIFASNDLMAFGAMDAIREQGMDIPNDISIVGYDDIPEASITHPKLTTVRQPLAQMGRVAVRLLLERIENPAHGPQRVTLATHLVVRDSCRKLETPTTIGQNQE